ncbi:hypothetical protein LCGC14_2892070, partial [marine sediment metagenome]
QEQETQPPVLSKYPKEEFDTHYEKAKALVSSGRRTMDDIKAVYESRADANDHYFTKKQRQKIADLKDMEQSE